MRGWLLAAAALVPCPPGTERPFPAADRSVILREEGVVYLVEGRVTIPRGVEVSCQKDVVIRAKGSAPAVIAVEGSLKAHGVSGREIIFEGVTIEPGASFDEIQLESCILRKGGGLATPKDGAAAGRILLQGFVASDRARVDLAMVSESFQLLDSSVLLPLRLRGIPGKDGRNRLKATIRGTKLHGIEASGVADLTVRLCGLRSDPSVFRDCAALVLDGNKVEGKELLVEQSRAGQFAGTRVIKCDLYPPALTFRAPADPARGDTVVLETCWFEGFTDAKSLAARIRDSADDPANNVRVSVRNPLERPLELVEPANR